MVRISIVFGRLHTEMAMWKTYGDYLKGSGWTNVLTQAGMASSGTADFLSQSFSPNQIKVCSSSECFGFGETSARCLLEN